MGLSRREFLVSTGSAILGAGASNADRAFEKLFLSDNQIDFRIKQAKEYFTWLSTNNALERLQIKESSAWERSQTLIASNRQNEVELIVPYHPEVKYLEVIGVRTASPETTGIKLVTLRAELPNIERGIQSVGLEFFSTNIFNADRLSGLPSVEFGFPPATSLSAEVTRHGMNPSALGRLRFGVIFHWELVTDTIPFVDDTNIFVPTSRALASWSEKLLRFNLVEIVAKDPRHLRLQDISEIITVGLKEGETSRGFNYYLL